MTASRRGGHQPHVKGNKAEADYAAFLKADGFDVWNLSPETNGCDLLAIGPISILLVEVKGGRRPPYGKARDEAIAALRVHLIQAASRLIPPIRIEAKLVHRPGPEGEWSVLWREER